MKVSYSLFAASLLSSGSRAVQPSTPKPPKSPLKDLPWSNQINFLHTTDTHGWHAGHLQEASFGGDWGDYISFAHHLKTRADRDGSDLLVIDTGDKVEGNGLYDSSDPKGKYTYDIYKGQDVDVIVCGNHELYKQNTSDAEYEHIVPRYKDNYIASNIDIIDPKTGERVPLAQRFRKFKSKNQGIQIMAFGFLYDFTLGSDHSFVKPVEEAIQESWFQDAIRDRSIDLFIVAGHSGARSKEFSIIFDEIRRQQWDTPIMFFGGHYHVRDYRKFDNKAYVLASGRYMETIGFQSIQGLDIGSQSKTSKSLASPEFARLYIDNNLHSLHHHSNTTDETFDTPAGKKVTNSITKARKALRLDERFGCAPRNLWTNRVPYPKGENSENSMFTWLAEEVIPEMVQDKDRADKGKVVMANTGTMRFDVLKGPFTRDTTFLIQPFTNGFRYIADVELEKVDQLFGLLNRGGNVVARSLATLSESAASLSRSLLSPEQYGMWMRYQESSWGQRHQPSPRSLQQMHRPHGANEQHPIQSTHAKSQEDGGEIVPGYTTVDDAGTDGDDTQHTPIDFYRVPNIFESRINITKPGTDENLEKVDLIFLDFVQPFVLSGLKYLGAEYTVDDTKPYVGDMDFTTMISTWVSRHWNDTDC